MAKRERRVVTQFVPAQGKVQDVEVKRPEGAGWRHERTNVFPVRGPEGTDRIAVSSFYMRKVASDPTGPDAPAEDSGIEED